MKVSVWDTYVKRLDEKIMHFDILVPNNITDQEQVILYGQKYLEQKPFSTLKLNSKICTFCHIEKASEEMIATINTKGYAIIELENCT